MCHFLKTYRLLEATLFLEGPFVREISFQVASDFAIFHAVLMALGVPH